MIPLVSENFSHGVGSVLEHVVLRVCLALLHLPDLLADGQHGVAEPVDLELALGLSWLHHESTSNRPGHGGGVEGVVAQPLGDVDGVDAARGLEGTKIDDELVGNASILAREEDLELVLEAILHVVGVQDRQLRRPLEAAATHHLDVHPGDREDGCGAPGSSRDRADAMLATSDAHRVVGKEGSELLVHSDGAHAWSSTPVRNAEGLVQVQVADVSSDVTRRAEANLRIHVGAVHVDQAAGVVDHLADLYNGVLKHSVGGGVGDHEGSEVGLVQLNLLLEVVHVRVAHVVALDGNDVHAAHGSGGGVGSVSSTGDEADVAVGVAMVLVVLTDRHQPCVLASSSSVGLLGDGIEAGNVHEPLVELVQKLVVSLDLIDGHEGMDRVDLGPGHGDHLRGGVELHGAGAKRDHRGVEAKILGLQVEHVAHELRLGLVLVEHFSSHELRLASQSSIESGSDLL
mmetsp:Transcript_28308/g.91616  ORF Transcript_28308/g.91616 Transcript_28308/m.91616 type:complete len:458 (+) Transcript_28308:216-1589(+)